MRRPKVESFSQRTRVVVDGKPYTINTTGLYSRGGEPIVISLKGDYYETGVFGPGGDTLGWFYPSELGLAGKDVSVGVQTHLQAMIWLENRLSETSTHVA